MVTRKDVVRACKSRGWILEPKGLRAIESLLKANAENADAVLQHFLESVQSKLAGTKIVTEELCASISEGFDSDMVESMGNQLIQPKLEVLQAFFVPKLSYESARQCFDVQKVEEDLFGSVVDKASVLSERFRLTYQRIQRHDVFRSQGLESNSDGGDAKITPIESLLGKQNHASSDVHLLLGALVQSDQGLFIEDLTGSVQIRLEDAQVVDSFFVTEHCILLVEGHFQDDTFYVHRIGQPLLEPRQKSLAAIQQQVSHTLFQNPDTPSTYEGQSVVIVGDIRMDQPVVVQHLEGLFASHEKRSGLESPLFVLMGSFSSSFKETNEQLSELLGLVSRFPGLCQRGHFCVVPNILDSATTVFPLPALPKPRFHKKMSNVQMCTNPCQLRWAGKDIRVFSHDVLQYMRSHHVPISPQSGADSRIEFDTPGQSLVKTILHQGHLLPVAGTPIYWNYDHALRLYPLPDVLILAGDNSTSLATGFGEHYGGCEVVHPGSFTAKASYAVLQPDEENEKQANFFRLD